MKNTIVRPPIVGVGASAGGLEAFQSMLAAIGDAACFAIVFVQHRDASSKELLAELIRSMTQMPVVELGSPTELSPGCVYICPPQSLVSIDAGVVRVEALPADERAVNLIDHFLYALAKDQGDRGIGVILSGSGSDGTLGLKAISDQGGLTFAQDSESAKFDSMPRSAATTGVADHVLPPAEIAIELLQYARHLGELSELTSPNRLQDEIADAIPAIANVLFKATQHNFQHYKTNTLVRRVQRRMQVLKIGRASDYVDYVTHREDEAYTIAMLCREVMDELENQSAAELAKSFDAARPKILTTPATVQIFATDIDERALSIGRAGEYPVGIEDQVSPERLKRFFVKRGKRYQATKEIRDLVLFSSHNLISDPPFSRQDLISCRNLLIYLGPHLQNKLIPLFHYALRPSGYLLLGPSESITSHGELFRPVDARLRISQRKGTVVGAPTRMTFRAGVLGRPKDEAMPPESTDFLDQDLTIRSFTPAILEIYDLIPTDTGRPLERFVPNVVDMPPLPKPKFVAKFVNTVDGDGNDNGDSSKVLTTSATKMLGVEHTVRAHSGRSYIRRVLPYQSHTGRSEGVVVTFTDITELSRSQDLFQLLVEASAQIVWITDADGNVSEDSPSWREFTGQTVGQFMGSGWLSALHPDDRQATLDTWIRAVHDSGLFIVEYRLRHHTGDYVWMLVRAVPQRHVDGSIDRWVGMNTDISDRKQREADAAEREQHLRNVIDGTGNFIGVLDADGTMLEVNALAVAASKVGREDLIGKAFWETTWWTYDSKISQQIREFCGRAASGESIRVDTFYAAIDGTARPIDLSINPIRDASGKITHLIRSGTDIFDRYTAVKELRRSEKLVRTIAENSTHAMVMMDDRGYVTYCNEALLSMTGYDGDEIRSAPLHDLIHHHYPDGRPYPIDQCPIDRALPEDFSVRTHEDLFFRKDGTTFEVMCAASPIFKDGVPVSTVIEIRDVTEQNAARRELIETQARLELSMEVGDTAVWNWNTRTGEVVPNENLNRLFGFDAEDRPSTHAFHDRIHSADRDRVTEAVQQGVAGDKHFDQEYRVLLPDNKVRWLRGRGRFLNPNGNLKDIELVDYEVESSGSREDFRPGDPSKLLASSATPLLSCKVLVVDDRRDIRFLSKILLTKAGATVDECEDGMLAVEHITDCLTQNQCPDLILLDMQMPNLDGYQTARKLRELGYIGPIIALTADAMQGDMNDCLNAGCNNYLSKPIVAKRLVDMVTELTRSEPVQ